MMQFPRDKCLNVNVFWILLDATQEGKLSLIPCVRRATKISCYFFFLLLFSYVVAVEVDDVVFIIVVVDDRLFVVIVSRCLFDCLIIKKKKKYFTKIRLVCRLHAAFYAHSYFIHSSILVHIFGMERRIEYILTRAYFWRVFSIQTVFL